MTKAQGFSHFIDSLEENLIAFFMGMMTLVTFANVLARYVFNTNILWALEVTVFLFAWLVLLGASYCVKKNLHLGVDVVLQLFSPEVKRLLGLLSVAACLSFAILMLIGGWNYWYPFITKLSFLETEDVPVPFFLSFLGDVFNHGEAYEKLPRFIPYLVVPLSMALLTYRFIQVGIKIWNNEAYMVIANHEAEVEDAMEMMKKDSSASIDKPSKKTSKKTKK